MSEKHDRLYRAWKLRHDIHAWLRDNIASTLPEVCAQFSDVNYHTLRQTMQKLCADLDVVMLKGRGNVGRYSAVSREIVPLERIRQIMSETGKNNVKHAHAGMMQKNAGREPKKKPPAKCEAARSSHPVFKGPRIDPARPWLTRHECGDTAPAKDSRGHGAVRQCVYVNCYQLF